MRIDRTSLRSFHEGVRQEWILANGLGGYASSTVIGANTRRYHGLLVAALNPPGGRVVLLSKLEEQAEYRGGTWQLSSNQYAGAIEPKGYKQIEFFEFDPFPRWVFNAGEALIEKEVFPVHDRNATVITYRVLEAEEPVTLRLRPLITSRDFHGETRGGELPWSAPTISAGGRAASFTLADYLEILHIASDRATFAADGYWYYHFFYREEAERGLNAQEDLYSPGVFSVTLSAGEQVSLVASEDRMEVFDAAILRCRALERQAAVQRRAGLSDPMLRALVLAADSFIVRRALPLPKEMPWLDEFPSRTVLAGYHWFSDWGRDTMIALPGLTLVTRRYEEARAILATFAAYCHKGLIPNRFLDSGVGADYNTVDAPLWFFWSVQKLVQYTGDYDFVRDLIFPCLKSIIHHYRVGTDFGIHMEDDGLISQGAPGVQLTWMDAKVGDWVVTPRHGKAVEICALWINALRFMEELAGRFGESPEEYKALADLATRGFRAEFWNEHNQCLDDVVGDPTIRPNQIIAASLPTRILSHEKERKVVDKVYSELYTSYGLRSLSPRDSRYVGHYGGDQWHRDGAYHQGTVWAWLIGPFITAYVRAHGDTPAAKKHAQAFLQPFQGHLLEAGLGTVSEIFDGDPPHHPRGCISQAWSVAEILRAAVEDLGIELPSSGDQSPLPRAGEG